MFIQNMTSCAVTVSPLDHLYDFRLTTTVVLLFEYTGAWPNDNDELSVGCAPVPNQYSGRYMRTWN